MDKQKNKGMYEHHLKKLKSKAKMSDNQVVFFCGFMTATLIWMIFIAFFVEKL